MKKSLVLAMAMAMGVTASAYAANPFSDVPAGHWAYDAVAKLADAGVVDGYGATFGGDKLMTRYEMAQIVAKAMAKGANTDKLAAEFADELDALGVRVAKLEKKVDNVKVTGQIRFQYQSHDNGGKDKGTFRTRLFVDGQINNNWSYTGMLQNQRDIMHGNGGAEGQGADNVVLDRAYLTGRLGGLKVTAGRWNEFFICDTILDEYIDGIQATYDVAGFKLLGLAGKYSSTAYGDHGYGVGGGFGTLSDSDNRLYVLGVAKKVGPVDLAFNYFKSEDNYGTRNIYNVNADWAFVKDFSLNYRYMWADEKAVSNSAKDGWFAQLNYKGADPAAANTWGLRARYFDQSNNAYIMPTYDFYDVGQGAQGGYEGWGVGGDYTLAKNIMLQLDYYDIEAKIGDAKDRSLYTQLWFFF